jgi:hypothetical protein
LVIVEEHEVVVPTIPVKQSAKVSRIRYRNLVHRRRDPIHKFLDFLGKFGTIRSKVGNDGGAPFDGLLDHQLIEKASLL